MPIATAPSTPSQPLPERRLTLEGIVTDLIAEGLAPGDVVVTAGVQTLRPGQKVRLLQAAP